MKTTKIKIRNRLMRESVTQKLLQNDNSIEIHLRSSIQYQVIRYDIDSIVWRYCQANFRGIHNIDQLSYILGLIDMLY